MARRDPIGIRLFTRNGHDWAPRCPACEHAPGALVPDRRPLEHREPVRVAAQRYRRDDRSVFLFAFDLLELDGQDLRREPLETRATLASILRKSRHGVRLNEHLEHPEGGRLSARLQDGARGDRLEASGVALSQWALAVSTDEQTTDNQERELRADAERIGHGPERKHPASLQALSTIGSLSGFAGLILRLRG